MATTIDPLCELRKLADAEAAAFKHWGEHTYLHPENYWPTLTSWLEAAQQNPLAIVDREMQELSQAFEQFEACELSEPKLEFLLARTNAQRVCHADLPRLERLPTVAQLLEQKVSHRQIGFTWRILTVDGQPDIVRVFEEIDNSGSVLTAEHVAAVECFRLEQMGFGPAKREAAEGDAVAEKPAPIPESLENLIRQRCTIDQIARIKAREYGVPAERLGPSVSAVAGLLRITLASNAQQLINEGGRATNVARMGEAAVAQAVYTRPHIPELIVPLVGAELEVEPTVDLNERIIALAESGNDVSAIAKEVGATVKQVKKVITTHERQAQPG